ncbi:uncharacterized protein MONBRDRAFT_22508 [Monosiga brevicollis MX1]|uniref:SUI1 domain-containing protein n=1 Tax=Monosiga brevicollis TaxID=81824 RepID=A9UQS8_MONBE|nr:uncharacterized protein MONBRDRAFT_22508 [Monosiga brevicollis MX1]EDQ93099.1 predicted protein [Monosiga brevicollis MX1]|eukprot:XP_001742861.1 hypothetical protein [Monosiga brevicollis MX1]
MKGCRRFETLELKGNRQVVRASDARRLRRELQQQFPLLADQQLQVVWPVGDGVKTQVELQKLQGHTSLYFVEGLPLFYTDQPKNVGAPRFWPSLYLLQRCPQIVSNVVIFEGVGSKIIKGADLFTPGMVIKEGATPRESWVHATFGNFAAGDFVAIRERGHWMPLATGVWNVSSSELEHRGQQGCSLNVEHCLDDALWLAGDGRMPTQPLTDVSAALQEIKDKEIAAEHEANLASHAAQLEEARKQLAAFALDGPKQIKRKQKALRQIQELRAKVEAGQLQPDADQQDKLGRESALSQELADLEARLARVTAGEETAETLVGPPPPPPGAAGPEAGTTQPDQLSQTTADNANLDADSDADVDVDAEVDANTPAAAAEPAGLPTDNADGTQADEAGDESADDYINMDQWAERAVLLALRKIKNADLPLLVSTFNGKHVSALLPRIKHHPPEPFNIRQTQFKKLATLMQSLEKQGVVHLIEPKQGVVHIDRVDRGHSRLLDVDEDDMLLTEEELAASQASDDADVAFATTQGASKQGTSGFVEARGGKNPRTITCAFVRKRQKNITVVNGLEANGIKLDEALRRDLANAMSASVSFGKATDLKLGRPLHIQGIHVGPVAKFLMERYQIPKAAVKVDTTNVPKHLR